MWWSLLTQRFNKKQLAYGKNCCSLTWKTELNTTEYFKLSRGVDLAVGVKYL